MITSMACDDTPAAIATLRLLAHYGSSAGLRALANFFDFDARKGAQCPSLSIVQRNGTSLRLAAYIAALTCVPGFKTKLWLTISSNLTSSYEFVWLRDSDVVTSPRLFLPSEVEHWMWRTDATVASPSVLPLRIREDRRSGWWTPFRSSFPGSCMVQTTPIVEQMTPIFRRAAFDGFHRHLASIPARFLETDFGLETFWCGFRWSDRSWSFEGTSAAAAAHLVGDTAPALPSCSEVNRRLAGRWTCGERVASLVEHGLDAAAARSRLYKEFPTICPGCTHLRRRQPAASAAVEAGDEGGRRSRCVLLHHVSVVHTDGRSIAKNLQANWSRFTRSLNATLTVEPNATDDLRGYLMQRWQSAMFQHGHPADHHHRSHRRRCWGDWAVSGEEIDDDAAVEAALKARRRTERAKALRATEQLAALNRAQYLLRLRTGANEKNETAWRQDQATAMAKPRASEQSQQSPRQSPNATWNASQTARRGHPPARRRPGASGSTESSGESPVGGGSTSTSGRREVARESRVVGSDAAACAGLLDDGSFDVLGRWCCAPTCGACKQESGCGVRGGGRDLCCPRAMRRNRYRAAFRKDPWHSPDAELSYDSPRLNCAANGRDLGCRVPWVPPQPAKYARSSNNNSAELLTHPPTSILASSAALGLPKNGTTRAVSSTETTRRAMASPSLSEADVAIKQARAALLTAKRMKIAELQKELAADTSATTLTV